MPRRLPLAFALTVALAAGLAFFGRSGRPHAHTVGIHKIRHVVVIMQENRSFDSYFGTYPGADGLPRGTGSSPSACRIRAPTAASGPTTTRATATAAARTSTSTRCATSNGGKMDGFIREARRGRRRRLRDRSPTRRVCSLAAAKPDVMGYHDAREIPNYWAYARNFVLQDHMFEPDTSWSLPAHLFTRLGVVGPLSPAARPGELRQRAREPARAAARAAEPDEP